MEKIYKIFSMKLARELGKMGVKCIGIEPNRNAPWLNVFLFEDTKILREALDKARKK